jgi:hypothetical protein
LVIGLWSLVFGQARRFRRSRLSRDFAIFAQNASKTTEVSHHAKRLAKIQSFLAKIRLVYELWRLSAKTGEPEWQNYQLSKTND